MKNHTSTAFSSLFASSFQPKITKINNLCVVNIGIFPNVRIQSLKNKRFDEKTSKKGDKK